MGLCSLIFVNGGLYDIQRGTGFLVVWQILSMLLDRSINPDVLNRHKQVKHIIFSLSIFFECRENVEELA